MLFNYRALKDNKIVNGSFEGTSEDEVIVYLKSNNIIPIEIKSGKTNQSGILNIFNSVSFQDISNYTRQLSLMLNAGLTLIDSIEVLKKQAKKIALLNLINDLNKEIRAGKSYSQALEKYPQHFPHLYIALVKAGEASGKLDMIMLKIADNMDNQKAFASKVKSALVYPTLIVVAGLALIFVLITFVLPGLTEVYKNFEVDLPASTEFIIWLSDFLAKYWYYVLAIIFFLVYLAKKAIQSKRGQRIKDQLFLKIPVLNELIKMSNLVDATRTFSILITSGVSILESLAITSEATSNIIFQEALREVYRQVEKGISLGDALANVKVFPVTLVQMAMVGEQTGKLDDTFNKISTYYQLETESALKTFTALIEPSILAVLGVIVGFLVMAVLTPIYSLTQSFGE